MMGACTCWRCADGSVHAIIFLCTIIVNASSFGQLVILHPSARLFERRSPFVRDIEALEKKKRTKKEFCAVNSIQCAIEQ